MFTGRWSSSSATRASARGAKPSAPALNTAFNVATTTTTTNTTPSIDTNTNTNTGNTNTTATATSTPTPPTSSPLPPLSSPVTSALSVSSPRTPRNSGGPGFPAFLFFSGGGGGTAGNRKSADSWNSWNSSNRGAAGEQKEWEWKSDQMLLLLRTLDALPSHLLTPFNGPVPPSNLLDKIARGVAQAKGPEEWPHSVRATRAKLVELARTRAEKEGNPAVAGGGKTRQRRRILEAEGEVDEYVSEVLQPTTNLASGHGHQNQHHQHHYQQNHNHSHHHHNGHDTRSGSNASANANTRRPLQQRQQTTAPAANRGDAMHLDRPDIRITESTNRRLQPSHLPASLSPLSSRPLNAVSTPSSSTLHSSSSSTALSVSSSASTSTFEDGAAAGRRPKSLRRCVSSVLAHAHGGNNNNNNTSTSSLSSSASASSREAMCVPAELLRPPPAIVETRAKTVPATPGAASTHHAQPTARVLRRAESFCAPSLSTMAAGGGGGSFWKKQSFKRAPTYGVVAGVYREAAEKIEAVAAAAAAVPRRGAGAGHAGAGAGGDAETEAAALALAACGCPSSDEEEKERLWTVKKVRRTKHASAPPAVRAGGGHRYDYVYDGRDEEDEVRMAVDGAAAVPASPVKPRTRKTSGPTARARTTSAPTAVGAGLVARKGKRVVQRNAGIFDAELPPLPPLPPQHQHQHHYRQQQQQQQQRQQQQQQQQPQAMRMAPPGLPAVVECSATSCASPSSPVATPPLTPTCTCPTTAASAMARKLRRIRATSFARDPARRISFGSLPAPASASASGGDGSGVLAGGAGFGGGAGGAGGGVEDAEMGAVGTTEEFEHAGPTLLGGCAGLDSAFQLQ